MREFETKRFSRRESLGFLFSGVTFASLAAIKCLNKDKSQDEPGPIRRISYYDVEAHKLFEAEQLRLPPPPDICLTWPVSGPISSFFSIDHPLGIDIDMHEDFQSDVKSAADGEVKFAGVHEGYGNYVIVDHSNSLETLYAHLREIKVKKGQELKTGEAVGVVGNTGFSTGVHLHFEVRYAGKFYNPLRFLQNSDSRKCLQ